MQYRSAQSPWYPGWVASWGFTPSLRSGCFLFSSRTHFIPKASFLRLQLLLGVTSSRLCSGQRGHVTTSSWELEEQSSGKV